MLLIFRSFRIDQDVEVGGKAGKVGSLSLSMTELDEGKWDGVYLGRTEGRAPT